MTSKGQVTVPKEVRDRLGLKAGDKIDFQLENDSTVALRKIQEKTTTWEDLRLALGPAPIGRPVTLEEIQEGIIRGAIYGEEGGPEDEADRG